jgi:hypothetical protein
MTGLGGTPLSAPDGPNGTCRLVFDIYNNGDGLSQRIIGGIQAMLKGMLLEMRVVAISDLPAAPAYVDSVDEFISNVTVSANGGSDPTEPGVACVIVTANQLDDKWSGPKGYLPVPDIYNETVRDVTPTTKICFAVEPKMNATVPPTNQAQVFHAVLQVRAKRGNGKEIDMGPPRDLMFVVPPRAQ